MNTFTGGIALAIVLALSALAWSGPEPETVNLTAPDCANPDARCYP